ncbi:MAG TPA: response regulator transcription factor, partial [Thermomicrobiales bacterium]|nr:response regulator transcription factor [Thermomicrobiales bacterium]
RDGAGWLKRVADVLRSNGTIGLQTGRRRLAADVSEPPKVVEPPEPHAEFRPRRRTAEATMADTRILLVEDEPSISGFVRRGLIFEGYEVEVVEDGRQALEVLFDRPPDLLILDLMLPGVDGIELTRRLRAAEDDESGRLPILMLTARDSVADRVTGLDAGADDYLVKPFDFDELLARVRALLRRTHSTASETKHEELRFADLVLDVGSRTVRRGGREIELTPREFDLLALFMRNPNQVLTRSTLMQRVWGEDFFGESNVLEVVIGNLRRALEAEGEDRLIQTVRGVGYVLRQR